MAKSTKRKTAKLLARTKTRTVAVGPTPEEVQARIDRAVSNLDTRALDDLLQGLYRRAKEADGAFEAAIELRAPLAPSETGLEGDIAINWANQISRAKRRIAYDMKVRGNFQGMRLVSEGDSWFQYPMLLEDVIDSLSEDDDKAILSLDAAGDVVSNMAAQAEFVDALAEIEPHAFLLSAGGNDLLGDGALEAVLRSHSAGAQPNDLLDMARFTQRLDGIMADYRSLLSRAAGAMPGLKMFSHGYDYAHPRSGGKWLGKPLAAKGIPLDKGRKVVALIVDAFNAQLAALSQTFPNYQHIDLRGVVDTGPGAWHDELHPTDEGYKRAAGSFRAALSNLDRVEASFISLGKTERFCCEADRRSDGSAQLEASSKPTVDRFEATTHQESRGGTAIDHIVVHYTTSRNINGSIAHFKAGSPKTSAHYLIGQDGELVQMVDDADTAWHAGPMNKRSIGIEHVAALGDAITPAQADVSARLIAWLMQEYGVPKSNVIPHRCVKVTSCCGDLFKAFGGKAGETCDVQRDALHAWMDSVGLEASLPEALLAPVTPHTPSVAVRGHMLVAEQSGRTGAGRGLHALVPTLITDATRLAGGVKAAVDESREFSKVSIGQHVDLSAAVRGPTAARQLLRDMFPTFESDAFDATAFNAFIGDLGLRHFTPVEFLFLGASNASGNCAGKNELPPQSLWPRIANTARMLDEIRDRLGAPVRILSCYRNAAYNTCIGGETQSLHMQFNAIDWRCDTGNAVAWRDVARAVRASDPRFLGGIGTYVGQNFVHIDTRGSDANWQK